MSGTAFPPLAWIDIDWQGRAVRIEHQWLNTHRRDAPLLVFLHEGLGSVAMWRDYPQQLCDALKVRGLVYSRPGYGQSTPRDPDEHWAPDFMHRQAHEVLPALLDALGVKQTPWLVGHSDGGSISLLYASRHRAAGLIVMAPHIVVEAVSITRIGHARQAYKDTDLRARLKRYHADVDSAFWGWNNIWLDPSFRTWSIEEDISTITCPVLAIQGMDDEYGTLAQIKGIAQQLPQAQLLELANCGHSPHRDQPLALTQACLSFFNAHHTSPISHHVHFQN
ncbi:alpha/beta hydrolase [Limnohabitans sp.]|uniref:alpha/beta fold hydrolase n=1 Tax=Limnohabitans sp. TaxID=1907725 RepID=UPI00286EE4EC|nr:alpha/beta hydrolase [Limnohabitans sp.]